MTGSEPFYHGVQREATCRAVRDCGLWRLPLHSVAPGARHQTTPAKAGVYHALSLDPWIPASAGMARRSSQRRQLPTHVENTGRPGLRALAIAVTLGRAGRVGGRFGEGNGDAPSFSARFRDKPPRGANSMRTIIGRSLCLLLLMANRRPATGASLHLSLHLRQSPPPPLRPPQRRRRRVRPRRQSRLPTPRRPPPRRRRREPLRRQSRLPTPLRLTHWPALRHPIPSRALARSGRPSLRGVYSGWRWPAPHPSAPTASWNGPTFRKRMPCCSSSKPRSTDPFG